jgi:hypothetical protein
VPVGQGLQDVAPRAAFAYVPEEHLGHNLDKLVTLLKLPDEHRLHRDCDEDPGSVS